MVLYPTIIHVIYTISLYKTITYTMISNQTTITYTISLYTTITYTMVVLMAVPSCHT